MKKQFYILAIVLFSFSALLAQDIARFEHKDKRVVDKFAQLEFYDSSETTMAKKPFETAKEFCDDLELDEKDDWHLSNELELDLIYSKRSEFKNLSQEFYWFDKEHEEYIDYAYTFLFHNGDKNYYNKKDENSFICSRGKEYTDTKELETHVKLMKHKYENGEMKIKPTAKAKDKNTTNVYIIIPAE